MRSSSPEDVAVQLGYAQRVVIVPGYGLAVAQGQHTVAELATALVARGVEVVFAIHPVAGRMPGHMNVLLAEANVPYESLRELEEVNPEFPNTDVALVVGANDVVNPAAKSTPGSPIYGMPILEVVQAQQVVFLKRSMRPGFAGIENELLHDPKTTLLFGDAKDSLTKVLGAVKASRPGHPGKRAGEAWAGATGESGSEQRGLRARSACRGPAAPAGPRAACRVRGCCRPGTGLPLPGDRRVVPQGLGG